MEEFYEFAGIRVRLRTEAEELGRRGILEAFSAPAGDWQHAYTVTTADQIDEDPGTRVYTQGDFCVSRYGRQTLRYVGAVELGSENATFRICREDSRTQLTYCRGKLYDRISARLLIQGLELEHLLTVHNGLILHASFITYEGRAILFTAPSETGKSTQAQLWCDHAGAELVNGDRAAVRILDDGIMSSGIPFSGSSPVCRNVTAPLAAIVCLSQAPENTITRLRGVRAFRRIWEGCTVNVWDRADVELATQTVSRIISRIPVYHLACTPDSRAVELLKNTLEVDP